MVFRPACRCFSGLGLVTPVSLVTSVTNAHISSLYSSDPGSRQLSTSIFIANHTTPYLTLIGSWCNRQTPPPPKRPSIPQPVPSNPLPPTEWGPGHGRGGANPRYAAHLTVVSPDAPSLVSTHSGEPASRGALWPHHGHAMEATTQAISACKGTSRPRHHPQRPSFCPAAPSSGGRRR
jgi:hypothetical protein